MGNLDSLRHAHLFVRGLRELSAAGLAQLHDRFRADQWTVVRDAVHPDRESSLQTSSPSATA